MYYFNKGLLVFQMICYACIINPFSLHSQNVLKGTVTDNSAGTPLIGARIMLQDAKIGAMSGTNGEFEMNIPDAPPYVLIVTYYGYDTLTYEITEIDKPVKLRLEEKAVSLEEVEITSTAQSEAQKRSPLTVESLSINAIKETPAANFYEGLSHLKGVDLNSASLAFKVINTRGFNSTSPVRSLQLIDGVDNQSPGLNFSLGNFLGASELDVESVELIVGASSAFYGPSAFNGVISMKTKNPFIHRGLSASVKVGERNLVETAVRYAKVFQNKDGEEKFAIKLNLAYLRADDWEADNLDESFRDTTITNLFPFVGVDNPGGYDAVNRYGDENTRPGQNRATSGADLISLPGLGIWHRTGYEESDLVNYDTRNLKASLALHYKLRPEVELIASSSYSTGSTVYQGLNRVSLSDIQFFQHKIEVRKQNKFFIRAYATHEDAGDSYDAVFTGIKLQEEGKNDAAFSADYRRIYSVLDYADSVRLFEGFPEPPQPPNFEYDFEQAERVLDQNNEALTRFHRVVRSRVDNNFLVPGTPEFQQAFDQITSTSVTDGGTLFEDQSALYHIHGEYIFNPNFGDITVGGNARLYTPETNGTIFLDTAESISNFEYGLYTGLQKQFLSDKFIVNAALRMDKNENFDYLFSPALSGLWNISETQLVRATFSSAIRNPTLADQYLFYNTGRFILIGNLDGFNDLVTLESFETFASSLQRDDLDFFDLAPIEPEKVRTFEVGYRGNLGSRLYVDASYYFSTYKDFIGFRLGRTVEFAPNNPFPVTRVFRVAANAEDDVTTQGFSIGMNYFFEGGYTLNGNYSWNVLNTETDDPIIPAFNTPEHKFNVGFSGRDIEIGNIRNIGFNVNYKWIEGFLFEDSPQFTGFIDTYSLLDAQINKYFPGIKTTFKLGASNVLNNEVFQVYGGPRIGRLAYFSATFNFDTL